MDSIEGWSSWFQENLPTKVSADARAKYSSFLIENEVFDLETLLECIELESDFLSAKINVKNLSVQNSIKKLLVPPTSGSTSPVPSITPTSESTKSHDHNSLIGFEPVTNIGSELSPAYWKIDNVHKLPISNSNRYVYSGSFTVANITHQVFIKRQLINNQEINDLAHEASIYKAIKLNPSLIELFYFHSESPNSYLVLEHFGKNLSLFLHGKCAIKLQIVEELGIALNALHNAGFVHCDIKPQNILIDSREGSVHLKLCDLDSAERVGNPFQHVNGALKYTEQWVSPEVYFGKGGELKVSPSIDVFSFGLIAAVLFDDAVAENKTILPRVCDGIELFVQCLTDQAMLNARMPCQRGKRYEDLIHRMCDLNPARRATLRDIDLALGLSRATAIHAQNSLLSKDKEFLKNEVIEKQKEIITHLQDIKQSLAELGAKVTQLLNNDIELKNMLATVTNGTFDCPTLFVYVPVATTANKSLWSRVQDPMSFVKDKFKLFFICSQTMEIVPCGPTGDGFQISCNKEWLTKAAPYIKIGLILLKEVMSVYHLPLPIANTLNLLENDYQLHSKYVDSALNFVTETCRANVLGKGVAQFDSMVGCLDETSRVTEMQSLDNSPGATKQAYESVKNVLSAHGHWNNVSETCGLVLATHKGIQAWIKPDSSVRQAFVESCEVKIHQQINSNGQQAIVLPTPPPVQATAQYAATSVVTVTAVVASTGPASACGVTTTGATTTTVGTVKRVPRKKAESVVCCKKCGNKARQHPPGTWGSGWSCDYAGHSGPNRFGAADCVYGCDNIKSCNYGVCLTCVANIGTLVDTAREQLDNKQHVKCRNQHDFTLFARTDDTGHSFLCDLCMCSLPQSEYRWRCNLCDVDYCFDCVPYPDPPGVETFEIEDIDMSLPKKYFPREAKPIVTCCPACNDNVRYVGKGVWNQWYCRHPAHQGNPALTGYDDAFACQTIQKCNEGVCGNCVGMIQNYCDIQRARLANKEIVTCFAGHSLTMRNGKRGAYKCNLCLCNGSNCDLRWCCAQCNTDTCFNCLSFPHPPADTSIEWKLPADVYIGDLVEGKRHGFGTNLWAEGYRFRGYWENDKRCGRGTIIYTNGSKFTGIYVNDDRCGAGVMIDTEKSVESGDFIGHSLHGQGVKRYISGAIWTGDFVRGEFTGKGVIKTRDGHTFEGHFLNGVQSGQCVLTYNNGNVYTGYAERNVQQGFGTMKYAATGETYTGEWQDDMRHGQGYMTDSNGKVSGKGRYVKDRKTILG